jgi:ABC-type transporter Mla subunit MlaD
VDDERIDTALGALRQALADVSLLTSIVVDLRRDADRLLAPLATELRRVRDAIDAALNVLPTR